MRFADHHIGRVLEAAERLGLADDTAVLVSSDHGENLGELGIYCDHQTADQFTTRLPAVLTWPGLDIPAGRVDDGLHYQVDLMATVLRLAGAEVPARWDGVPFLDDLLAGRPTGRSHLVLSSAAWTAQRSVRVDRWICIRTYHDAFHGFPDVLLFDLDADPHEQYDVAGDHPEVVARAVDLLAAWGSDALARSDAGVDPLWTVLTGGGPWHSRTDVPAYLERLRATGRGAWADRFALAGWPRAEGDPRGFLDP